MSATVPTGTERPPSRRQARDETDAEELREQAIANLKRQRKFAADVIGYVTVNGVLWLIWALTDRTSGGWIPWPAWVSLIWGVLLLGDAWRAYGPWPRSLRAPITEDEIDRETKRLGHA